MIGLLGRKVGMTRVYTTDGKAIPVSVVHVTPNHISQIKTMKTDGYEAIQLTAGTKKANRVTKPLAGHFAKAHIEPGDMLTEFRVNAEHSYKVGDSINVETVFQPGQYVDVSGVSKGKGFAGAVKRHNFKTQDATHGNSLSHRAPGSIGQNQTPGRVFKGKKMPGQMGNANTTVQSLEVVQIDADKHVILIKGAIPGAPGACLKIKPAVKIKHEEA